LLAVVRGVPLAILVFGCLVILLLARLIERPLCGIHRPVTPWITVFVCRNALRIMGISYQAHGKPMLGNGVMVANHSSWLDIFALNAAAPLYFVSKAEVAAWPGIGWLARATGTVFIERDRRKAREHTQLFEARLLDGHRLLFFPEGTSTDGMQVLPFKSTLYGAFFSEDLRNDISVQPVSVVYHAPTGEETRYYGWWGDMAFGPHLLRTLARGRQGRVEIMYHAPIPVADTADRKTLAQRSETLVRQGHETLRAG
jgi:1-acyl-sn-glycerol-3-phosphate acyltransferase